MCCEICKVLSIDTASENYWACPMIGLICETHCTEIQLGEVPEQLYLLYTGPLLCKNCCHGDNFYKKL